MTIRHVPRDRWSDELDSFSRQHEGWIVSIQRRSRDGQVAIKARDIPLQGVNPASPQSNDIAIVSAIAEVSARTTCTIRRRSSSSTRPIEESAPSSSTAQMAARRR